jgi:hypothetical protein
MHIITLGRCNHTLEDNIEKKENAREWTQNRNQWWAVVSTVRNLWVP